METRRAVDDARLAVSTESPIMAVLWPCRFWRRRFAPGRRIGFYGSYSGIIGWIYSAGLAAQITIVRGRPEVFGGESRMVGISVDTIGWFDIGLIGAPIGAHQISNTAGREIGYTFE